MENSITKEEYERILKKIHVLPNESANLKGMGVDELILPTDSGAVRSSLQLSEEAYDIALPKLLNLQRRYPLARLSPLACQ